MEIFLNRTTDILFNALYSIYIFIKVVLFRLISEIFVMRAHVHELLFFKEKPKRRRIFLQTCINQNMEIFLNRTMDILFKLSCPNFYHESKQMILFLLDIMSTCVCQIPTDLVILKFRPYSKSTNVFYTHVHFFPNLLQN